MTGDSNPSLSPLASSTSRIVTVRQAVTVPVAVSSGSTSVQSRRCFSNRDTETETETERQRDRHMAVPLDSLYTASVVDEGRGLLKQYTATQQYNIGWSQVKKISLPRWPCVEAKSQMRSDGHKSFQQGRVWCGGWRCGKAWEGA